MPTRILLVDADPALEGLLQEWLDGQDCCLVEQRPDLVLVDLPFPRERGAEVLARVAREHPGVPVVALSSAFFAGIDANGAVARGLGVARVLPKPLSRDALMTAVRHALG